MKCLRQKPLARTPCLQPSTLQVGPSVTAGGALLRAGFGAGEAGALAGLAAFAAAGLAAAGLAAAGLAAAFGFVDASVFFSSAIAAGEIRRSRRRVKQTLTIGNIGLPGMNPLELILVLLV